MASIDLSAPALAAPSGITPNFQNPSNGNGIASFSFIIMMVISSLCILLRSYGKVFLTRKVRVEDVLILLAYGSYWGCAWSSYALIYTPGYFVHTWDLVLGSTIEPYYYVFVFGVFYSVVLALLKVAILVEWCRVFVPAGTRTRNYFWWGSAAVIALQAAFGVAAIFLLNLQCIPHQAIWDFTITDATCIPLNPLQLLSATIHLVSDVAIFLLPQKVIWALNMSLQKRLGVAVVFGLGALAVVCSILRLKATIDFGRSSDTMYNIGPVVLWATGEMTCGFFVACMPMLPRALKETAWIRKLAKALGLKYSLSKTDGAKRSIYETGGRRSHKTLQGSGLNETYLQIDEDGVPMDSLKHMESTKQLREVNYSADRITRTTHITFSHEQTSGGGIKGSSSPWIQ